MTSGYRHIRAHDLEQIKKLHAKGLDDHEIADRLNCARTTVLKFRHRLKLPANGPINERTKRKRARSLRRTFRREWGVEGVHQIHDVLKAKDAAKVGWAGFSRGDALILNALEDGTAGAREVCRRVETIARRNRIARYRRFGLQGFYIHSGPLRRAGWIEKFWRGRVQLYSLTEQAQQHMRDYRSRTRERATA